MGEWSIQSNIATYIQCDWHPKNVDIKGIDQKSHKKIYNKEEERHMLKLDLGDTPEKLNGDHL